jgi:hypothetical protein
MAFRKSSHSKAHFWKGNHRFEHWYRDNTCYFITSKVRDGHHAFAHEQAKCIFWDRFDYYTKKYGFVPWIASLLDNHYHVVGFLKIGENLGPLMQHLHGSVAKLVNDTLPQRHLPFWRHRGNQDYFDGCLRDVLQATRAYRYTKLQAVRAGIVRDFRDYPHTHVYLDIDRAVRRAVELNAFLDEVPYARYERRQRRCCGARPRTD